MPNTKNAIGYPTEEGGFQEMGNTAPKVNMTADDISYDNSQSGASATNVQAAVDEAFSDLSELRGTLLWENTSPTSSFATQDITLDSGDYSVIKIVCRASISSDKVKTFEARKGDSLWMDFVDGTYDGKPAPFRRNATYVNDTKYTISDCFTYTLTGLVTDGNGCVPIAVYGIK